MRTSEGSATAMASPASPRQEDSPVLLVIDDDPMSIEYIREALADRAVQLAEAANTEVGLALVGRLRPDLILLDLMLPDGNGIDLLGTIREVAPESQIFIMTAHYSTESAVKAIQAGADDYLNKPVRPDVLRERVDAWLQEQSERKKATRLEKELLESSTFEGIVGRSARILDLLAKVRRVAPHFQTALVSGETGTGKESISKALHIWSQRQGSFVVCNCASVVDTLFESELFGHKKGAFTGATEDRAGLVEAAQRGTLFLDEVGEMPLPLQAKLLRLVQNREVRRLGESTTRTVDIRIVAATNRDLRKQVAEGTFREDLLYRLSTVDLKLPSLRERAEDLPLLFRHFLGAFSSRYGKPGLQLTRRAEILLTRWSWPGNIRELENSLSYACMMTEKGVVDIVDFPEYLLEPAQNGAKSAGPMTLAQVEQEHVMNVLKHCDGNRARTAEVLGIGRATLYRLLARQ